MKIIEFFYGGISGMFGVVLSHPFDTIKSNIQNGYNIKLHNYTFKQLYKGLIPPLIGTTIEKSIVFGTYNTLKKYNDNTPLNGFISGFIASFIITPYERLKIIKQNKIHYNYNALQIMPLIRSLYSGLSMCILRDSPGFAIYFTNYEYLKKKFYTDNNTNITKTGSFLIGGSSGLISWIFIYPQDKIKTILQSKNINNISPESNNIGYIIRSIYKNGIFNFYKGFSYALARAVPLHAGTFMMYEFLTSI